MVKLRIRPVTLCRVQADKGTITYLTYYGEKIWRPYIFFIIEGARQNILVDTAIHAEDYKAYHPGCRNLPFEALKTFENALSEVSLQPDDIDLVIQTHLHIDHCFNTPNVETPLSWSKRRNSDIRRPRIPFFHGCTRIPFTRVEVQKQSVGAKRSYRAWRLYLPRVIHRGVRLFQLIRKPVKQS